MSLVYTYLQQIKRTTTPELSSSMASTCMAMDMAPGSMPLNSIAQP